MNLYENNIDAAGYGPDEYEDEKENKWASEELKNLENIVFMKKSKQIKENKMNSVTDALNTCNDLLKNFIKDYEQESSIECKSCNALVFSKVIEYPVREKTVIQRRCCSTDDNIIQKNHCPNCGTKICVGCGKVI